MRRALGLVVVAFVIGVGGNAHADPTKAFKKFFADLTADPDAAAAFVDGADLVVLPRADGVVQKPKAITVEDLVGPTTGTVSFKVKKVKKFGLYQLEAVAADVDATIKEGKKKRVVHLRV